MVVVAALLPFGVIPVRLGLTVTLLEAALIGTIAVWLLRLLLDRRERLPAGIVAAFLALVPSVWLFAFALGLGRGYTSQTFHDFFKFLLASSVVIVVWSITRSLADARRTVMALLCATGAAAALGLLLYGAGAGVTERVLSRLIPLGYPSSRIVRYIEDDPAKPMRLVGTSVDPNSFGGFLAVVCVLAATQLVASRPVIDRRISGTVALVTGAAMLLTYSRGAWVGTVVGLAVIALLRYRWLIVPGLLAGIGVVTLGLGGPFLQRLWLGLTLQDPATRLRLAEYRNALAIIRQHPVFGVGFGDAPSIEQQTGVSSIYLTIAERAGLVGLLVFAIAVGTVLVIGLRHWRRHAADSAGDLTLGLLAALSAALVIGLVDHYFFNITFPHMAALFWLVAGLLLALAHPVTAQEGVQKDGVGRPSGAVALLEAERSGG